MYITVFADKGTKVRSQMKNVVERHEGHLDVVYDVYRTDFSDLGWEEYTSDALGPNRNDIMDYACDVKDSKAYYTDVILLYVSKDNWRNGDREIWGWHLGGTYKGYHVIVVKERPNASDTIMHELMHTYDNFVYEELGKKLKKVFGVSDYDEGVVHGEITGIVDGNEVNYEEYDYEWALARMGNMLSRAFQSRVDRQVNSLIRNLPKSLRRFLVNLTDSNKEDAADYREVVDEAVSSPNRYDGGNSRKLLVLHVTLGSYESVKNWFQSEESQVSSHFVVARDGRVCQMVNVDDVAWHAGVVQNTSERANRAFEKYGIVGENPNSHSIGIEFCAHYDADEDGEVEDGERRLTQAQVDAGVKLLSKYWDETGKSNDEFGDILTHRDITDYKPYTEDVRDALVYAYGLSHADCTLTEEVVEKVGETITEELRKYACK